MKTTRNYNIETVYRVKLTQSDTLDPIQYTINAGPFSFQDYLTIDLAEHLHKDLGVMIEMAKRESES